MAEVNKGSFTALHIFKPLESASENSLSNCDCVTGSVLIILRLQSETFWNKRTKRREEKKRQRSRSNDFCKLNWNTETVGKIRTGLEVNHFTSVSYRRLTEVLPTPDVHGSVVFAEVIEPGPVNHKESARDDWSPVRERDTTTRDKERRSVCSCHLTEQ